MLTHCCYSAFVLCCSAVGSDFVLKDGRVQGRAGPTLRARRRSSWTPPQLSPPGSSSYIYMKYSSTVTTHVFPLYMYIYIYSNNHCRCCPGGHNFDNSVLLLGGRWISANPKRRNVKEKFEEHRDTGS